MAYSNARCKPVDPKEEAIALIHARWDAFDNKSKPPDPRIFAGRKKQLYSVPERPAPVYEVGMSVALYHTPRLARRIIAIAGDEITVMHFGEPLTVNIARVKPLIPQGGNKITKNVDIVED
jgi:hypothetical protein